MKKVVAAMLVVLCIVGIFVYRWKTINDITQIAYNTCEDFVANYDYSKVTGFTIDSIDFRINKVKKSYGRSYLVDITWYINYSDSVWQESVRNERLLGIVMPVFVGESFYYNNNYISFTHSDKSPNDCLRVVGNGGASFSGQNERAIREMKAGNGKDYHGHSKYDAMEVAKTTVKERLKSPSTAKFCSVSEATFSCDGNSWTVSGWVDAQNSFGAVLRNSFTVKFTCTDDSKYSVDYCEITER